MLTDAAVLDLLLMTSLGFLGSFGHCLGMCGPLTAVFSLHQSEQPWQQWQFHGLLNLGRLLSYGAVGLGIGAVGSVLVASGQIAGLGSSLRQGVAIATGAMLVWFGIGQINPKLLPPIPLLNPMAQGKLHQRLSQKMSDLGAKSQGWIPLVLGLIWGLMPCGFLYAAQIKAAETTSPWYGAATMIAFGLGTLPTMLGVGISTAWLSADRRSQLFRLGGWLTLIIGLLTLVRAGTMVDFSGHGALVCLGLALVARPVSRLWPWLLPYRRTLGVGAFVLTTAHVAHMVTMGWRPAALPFLTPPLRLGAWAGLLAFALMIPLTLTSCDRAYRFLGHRWRQLHRLSLPIFVMASGHALLVGTSYLGSFDSARWSAVTALGSLTLLVLLLRLRWFWSLFSLGAFYASPKALPRK